MDSGISVIIEAVLILVLPVVALLLNKKLYHQRLKILASVFLLTLIIAVWREVPEEILGFSAITSPQLLWYIVAGIVFSILLMVGHKLFSSKNQIIPNEIYFSSVLLSFAQEFIFNAYFLGRFSEAYGIVIAVIIVGLLFAIMHQALEKGVASFVICFFAGVLLAVVYAIVPNLWLATLVHSLANIQALHYRLPGIGPSLEKLEGTDPDALIHQKPA